MERPSWQFRRPNSAHAAASATVQTARTGPTAARIRLPKPLRRMTREGLIVLSTTVLLVLIGTVMVLSASQVESKVEDGGFVVQASRQLLFAAIGIPAMLLASQLPQRAWMRLATPFLGFTFLLQVLVVATPLGVNVNGNQNWLKLGPLPQFQPSEWIKVALVLWIAMFITRKAHVMEDFWKGLFPILLVSGAGIMLVMLGKDLGTSAIMGVMVIGGLFLAGVKFRLLLVPTMVGAAGAAFAAATSGNRMARLLAFASQGCQQVDLNACWQSQQGSYALANGGLFGVGLGNSAAKWAWLPEADNDFIFAIIGEEAGLIGAIVVISLFVLLAFGYGRGLAATDNPFGRVVASCVVVWIVGQAFVNIGVVLGVMPVLGVPLPLVSAGGSALITTLIATGLVLSTMRSTGTAPAQSAPSAYLPRSGTERMAPR
ncbi:MAG TPA: putative lipid II flippase FtsW [Candidatus Lumbricidophila sp.]|nr:putative lipid II flippase FtsW [Candidatus Lumbricidophila sp.]